MPCERLYGTPLWIITVEMGLIKWIEFLKGKSSLRISVGLFASTQQMSLVHTSKPKIVSE